MISKNVLFYSNYCQHSKDVLGIITKKNLKDYFVYVCVDNTSLKLPTFVDRVPMICTSKKQIYMDESLIEFVNSLGDLTTSIEAGGDIYNTNSISDQYSFIDETDSSINKNYVYIGQDVSINVPPDSDVSNTSVKLDKSMLDNLISQRDMDLQMINKYKS